LQDVIIPEAEYPEAFTAEKGVATGIMIGLLVLPAVRFDYQSRLQASEVRHVGSDRMLAPELVACHRFAIAQDAPQRAFGVGHFATQLTCESGFLGAAHLLFSE
jgi:hypothetical protein